MGRGRWKVGYRPPRGREGKYWQLRCYPPDGKPRREHVKSTRAADPEGRGATNREDAERIAREHEAFLNGESPGHVVRLYLEHCEARVAAGSLRESTLERKRRALASVGDLLDSTPTEASVLRCLDELRSRMAQSTTREVLAIARTCWSWAHSRGYAAAPWPTRAKLPRARPTSLRPPTPAQVAEILACAARDRPYYYPALALAYQTGARGCEVVALNGEDVDRVAGVVRFHRHNKTPGSAREVGVGADLIELLPAAAPGPLFLGRRNGERMTVRALLNAWNHAVEVAGLAGERIGGLHALRRLWASTSQDAGVPEQAAMAVLGHASPASFRIYSRFGVQRRALEAANAVRAALPALPQDPHAHSRLR